MSYFEKINRNIVDESPVLGDSFFIYLRLQLLDIVNI